MSVDYVVRADCFTALDDKGDYSQKHIDFATFITATMCSFLSKAISPFPALPHFAMYILSAVD